MKFKIWIASLVIVAAAACNGRHETPTASYGQGMLAGEVIMSEGAGSGSPAGVEVGVRGTGMTMVLAEDGLFSFAGVPAGAELDFRRAADGIEASLHVDQSSGYVVVELAKTTATASSKAKGSKRRGASKTRETVYEFEGTIVTAAPDSIVVFTSKKVEQTIAIAADTIIRKGNQTVAPADLAEDMRVHVKARKADDVYTAAVIIVQQDGTGGEDRPAVREYEGTVRSSSATELVVFTSHREEVTFAVNEDTVIRKGNTPIAPEDILIGTRVHVKATVAEDGTATATSVWVQNTRIEVSIEGTVASVGTSSLVVTTAGGDVTVQVSSSTQIRKSGKKISLSAIETGDTVEVEGTKIDETTVQARKITVED